MLKPIFLTLILHLTTPKTEIHIWEPSELRNKYKNTSLHFTLANFGKVPYGHSIFGTVFKASPSHGCTDLQSMNWDSNQGIMIVFLERGGCHFSKKVINARKIGAGLVLIGDSVEENVEKILPFDENLEVIHQIDIPMLFLSKNDATNFSAVLNSDRKITMAVNFDLVKVDEVVEFLTVIQVDDFRTYDFVTNFYPIFKKLKDHINLKIRYKIVSDPNIKEHCIINGDNYCVRDRDGIYRMDLAKETLYQICLLNTDTGLDEYIDYMSLVKKNCFKSTIPKSEFANCLRDIYVKNITKETQEKLKDCSNPSSDNAAMLLKLNNLHIKNFLLNYSPLIYLNDQMYRGNYDDFNSISEVICNSFEKIPDECGDLSIFEEYHNFSGSILSYVFKTLIFFVFISVCAIFVFYVFYRTKIKKEFEENLQKEINVNLSKFYNQENDYEGIETK